MRSAVSHRVMRQRVRVALRLVIYMRMREHARARVQVLIIFTVDTVPPIVRDYCDVLR